MHLEPHAGVTQGALPFVTFNHDNKIVVVKDFVED